jgi:hypothetical protein
VRAYGAVSGSREEEKDTLSIAAPPMRRKGLSSAPVRSSSPCRRPFCFLRSAGFRVDRNPQRFVDIYSAKKSDYRKGTQRIYRTRSAVARAGAGDAVRVVGNALGL